MRIVAPRIDTDDDLLDESDIPFNDEDDEPIFSPVNTRRSYRYVETNITKLLAGRRPRLIGSILEPRFGKKAVLNGRGQK